MTNGINTGNVVKLHKYSPTVLITPLQELRIDTGAILGYLSDAVFLAQALPTNKRRIVHDESRIS